MRALIAGACAALLVAALAGTALGAADVQPTRLTVDLTGRVLGGPECVLSDGSPLLITLTHGTFTIMGVDVIRDGGLNFAVHGSIRDAEGVTDDGTDYRVLGPFTVTRSFNVSNGSGTFTLTDHTRLISEGNETNAIATLRFHVSFDADGAHVRIDEFSLKCV